MIGFHDYPPRTKDDVYITEVGIKLLNVTEGSVPLRTLGKAMGATLTEAYSLSGNAEVASEAAANIALQAVEVVDNESRILPFAMGMQRIIQSQLEGAAL